MKNCYKNRPHILDWPTSTKGLIFKERLNAAQKRWICLHSIFLLWLLTLRKTMLATIDIPCYFRSKWHGMSVVSPKSDISSFHAMQKKSIFLNGHLTFNFPVVGQPTSDVSDLLWAWPLNVRYLVRVWIHCICSVLKV